MFPSREILPIAVMGSFVVCASTGHADVKISTKATSGMTCSGGICSPTAKKAILNATDLANMLASGDVTVKSGNLAQDIEIDATLTWTSTHRLMLDSYHSIAFNAPVTVAGTGGLTITTSDGGSNGDFRFFKNGNVKFWDTHATLVINGNQYALLPHLTNFKRALRNDGGMGRFFAITNNWSLGGRTYTAPPINKDFSGTLEGLGNSISNLKIQDNTIGENLGLFHGLDLAATVRDINLNSANITGLASGQRVGALAGGSSALLIQGVRVSGTISATGPSSYAGGLVGTNNGIVVGCGSDAAVLASGGVLSGGLIGWNVFDRGFPASIATSYSYGAVSNVTSATGGLVAKSDGGSVSNSFVMGSVTATGTAPAGGLIGLRSTSGGSPTAITGAYSTGAVSGGSGAPVGGSIGEDDVAGSGITHDYWDLDTSGVSNPHQGAGNVPDDPGITGLTDAQLKSGLPPGFDKKVWAIDPKINNGYPYLIDNPPPK